MSEITSVEPQKRDKSRCNIYVDGRFYCGVKLEVAVRFQLKAGMHIEKSKLDEIQLETEKSQALDRALTYISASMKTEKQVRDYLAGKGYTPLVCDYVLDKLKYYNFVDDYAYCRAYISGVRGKGKRALEADLYRRGAARAAIEETLAEVEESDEDAVVVLQKYLKGKPHDRQTLFKGYKYLVSKGFGADTARSALSKFGGGDEDY